MSTDAISRKEGTSNFRRAESGLTLTDRHVKLSGLGPPAFNLTPWNRHFPVNVSTSDNDVENLCSTAASPCRTIGRAVNVAISGDPIQLAAGIYTETLNISKSLSILGADRENTVIQAHVLAGMADRNVIRLNADPPVSDR